jgi:hypothetical protein
MQAFGDQWNAICKGEVRNASETVHFSDHIIHMRPMETPDAYQLMIGETNLKSALTDS